MCILYHTVCFVLTDSVSIDNHLLSNCLNLHKIDTIKKLQLHMKFMNKSQIKPFEISVFVMMINTFSKNKVTKYKFYFTIHLNLS